MRIFHILQAFHGVVGACRSSGTTDFVQAAAEDLPFPAGTFDCVYSVYMFHELPDAARGAALADMARVLKPGGTLIGTDSTPLGDRPPHDASMGNFENMNEPYYRSYIEYDFGAKFKELGLAPGVKVLQSVTKSVAARKPAPA